MNAHHKTGTVPAHWEQSVVHSALWAAAGDALGWITELANGRSGVRRRTGKDVVKEPVGWQRIVGGRTGPKVDLPAGTYSDDTQLRLAVSRSIRSNGFFDVETFAKVELTVWPTYALGAGLGTKAAATGLSKRGVTWFSNFFESKGQRYIKGGGNGAAMRVQPHVWGAGTDLRRIVLDVLRDAITTHGHPHGFGGAIFHAISLAYTLEKQEVPHPRIWVDLLQYISDLPEIITHDSQLSAFWMSAWENSSGISLQVALDRMLDEACRDIDSILQLVDTPDQENYREILHRLGCDRDEYRGSGFKTSLAALALSYMYRGEPIELALQCAANAIESDTDTIATMVGAILGGLAPSAPTWNIQDREYLIAEATRLAAVASGNGYDSFSYPDIGLWNPPASQAAAVGQAASGLVIAGLGNLRATSKEYPAGDAIWQWFKLPFGQTILAKRRTGKLNTIQADQLPREPRGPEGDYAGSSLLKATMLKASPLPEVDQPSMLAPRADSHVHLDIDELTDQVISSNFDNAALGRAINYCIDASGSINSTIALAAIIAKAKLTRQRRRR